MKHRNDIVETCNFDFKQRTRRHELAALFAPEFCSRPPSRKQRVQGRPGGRCTRGPRAKKLR
ncbi:MAG: hypothetical protein ACM3OF_02310, partial [Gemmatimonas sp.]